MPSITINIQDSTITGLHKVYQISDADLEQILAWATVTYAPQLPQPPDPPPSNNQVFAAWSDAWMNGTTDAVQRHHTEVTIPPPINIGGAKRAA